MKMMVSEGSRGWLWSAVLLTVLCTCRADEISGNVAATSPQPPTTATSPNTTVANSTMAQANTTAHVNTTTVPKTSPTTPTPKPLTTSTTTSTTTKGPTTTTATTASSTSVTSKGTSKPTETTSSTASPETSTMSSGIQKISGFDLGSFIGGIVLTMGILAAVYFGCRFYNSRRGVRYRTIDEHEAII